MHMPEYTTYTFLPSRPVPNGPTHAVVFSSSPTEKQCSYVAMNRGEYIELAREPDDPTSDYAAIFHLPTGRVSPRGAQRSAEKILYTKHSACVCSFVLWHRGA